MRQSVDQQAAALQRRLNDEISAALAGRSRLEWDHVAAHVAERLTDDTGWEYQIVTAVGGEPRAVITRHDPYRRSTK